MKFYCEPFFTNLGVFVFQRYLPILFVMSRNEKIKPLLHRGVGPVVFPLGIKEIKKVCPGKYQWG